MPDPLIWQGHRENTTLIGTRAGSDETAVMRIHQLGEFLLEHGKPDEIWVYTNSSGPINSPDRFGFLISLFCREKQMIAAYGKGKAIISDIWINGCIQFRPSLERWSLDKPLSFPEAASLFYNTNVIEEGWKEIPEATRGELDID